VGRTAVHVARKHGVHVFAGVKSSQREEASKLGAERVVALDDDNDIASLRDLDAIADTVNGETIAKLLKAIKPGGVLGSVLVEPKDAAGKKLQVHAIMAQPDATRLYELAEDIARGEFSIPIAKVFPLEEARKAQDFAEHQHPNGKVLLVP
jgi:NADPH:quinone reductase-like Zn-dependent oxidoreductase